MPLWLGRGAIKSDLEKGLFRAPTKRPPNTELDCVITDIILPDTKVEESKPKKRWRFDQTIYDTYRAPLGPNNSLRSSFAQSINIFDPTARRKYQDLISSDSAKFDSSKVENGSTSLVITTTARYKEREASFKSQVNDSLNESGFLKLFDPSVFSSSKRSEKEKMGNLPSFFHRKGKKQETLHTTSSDIENLKQIVDALKPPSEFKLVPYDNSIHDETLNETIDLSYVDSHPPPQRSPRKKAVEVQPILIDNDTIRKGLDNSKIKEIDLKRIETQFKTKRQEINRNAEIAKLSETSVKLEHARIKNEIEAEERSRLMFGFENLVLDIPKEKDSFPPLPQEAITLIHSAWNKHLPEDEVFVDTSTVKIKRKDLLTLSRLDWLNDEVINFYLDLVVQRSTKDDSLPKVYAFQTFFYTTLNQRGYAGVKRWTRKVDVFSYDIWIVPVHLTHHWCMAIVDLENKKIEYYDSMLGNNRQVFELLTNYIDSEMQDKKKQQIDTRIWQLIRRQDIPTQQNGSDCGMFACKFAEYASRRAEIDFNQIHMPYFRQRIVWEIFQQNLM